MFERASNYAGCLMSFWNRPISQIGIVMTLWYLSHRWPSMPVLLCAVKMVECDFRFCWAIYPNVGQTHKENPELEFFIWYLHYMIYTNSTTNYTNIDTQKSVLFTVLRTETRLKMHQTCIWSTGHMQSIAGPVLTSAVWTDEKKKTLNCSYRIFIIWIINVSPVF